MSLNNDHFERFSRVGFNNKVDLEGLDLFIKNLEKHFFSQVTVRNCSTSMDLVSLVVELDCNFGLLEALRHFENDTWGSFKCQQNSFTGAQNLLQDNNDIPIVIEEFSLFFKDTSIIVNRIYDLSVSQQLQNIFIKLNEHTLPFTKELTELPYEIYIPVFEEHVVENEHTILRNICSDNNNEQDYFSFWGLYYYSEDDAVVYDLKNHSIIKGNLQMLNR